MIRSLVCGVALLLTGCATPAHAPDAPVVVADMPPAPVKRQVAVPVPPTPPGEISVAALSPVELLGVADQARADASGYVAWKHSRAENIDRLADLTAALNTAVARMKAGRTGGKYRPADVLAARSAVRQLRMFLAQKGD